MSLEQSTFKLQNRQMGSESSFGTLEKRLESNHHVEKARETLVRAILYAISFLNGRLRIRNTFEAFA